MPKQAVSINFGQGVDTKPDPKQLAFGKFVSMVNSVFTTTNLWKKRNGYGSLPSLPDNTSTYVTTFEGNLTAIGNKIEAFSNGTQSWINKGTFQPVSLAVAQTVRSSVSQTFCDSVIAQNGYVCTVYSESANGVNFAFKYSIQDSVSGQNIIPQTPIPVSSGAVSATPRVFLLGGYFIIVFTNTITATTHLQFVAVSVANPTTVSTNFEIGQYATASTVSWDGIVNNNRLFIAFNTVTGGQQIVVNWIDTGLNLGPPVSFLGEAATMMSASSDGSRIFFAYYTTTGTTGKVIAVDNNLNKLMLPTTIISSGTVLNITNVSLNGVCTVIYEVSNNYSYDAAIPTHFLNSVTVTAPNTVTTGTVGATVTAFVRSLGLASKAFMIGTTTYVLGAYQSVFQPTYFMVNLSGNVIAKWAYQNGGGYLTLGLPQAQVIGSTVNIAYLLRTLIQPVNKAMGAANPAGVYAQTGVNLAAVTFGSSNLVTSEIAENLHLTGGFLYAYDGTQINEQNFHLFPDNVEATWSPAGGNMAALPDGVTHTNAYFYQVIYQWTDAQGNIIQSAPSIPVGVTTTSNGTTGSVTLNGPMIRLTYKTTVKILIFRWSVAQTTFFQVTSISGTVNPPVLNSTTTDSWTFLDTLADASIAGNSIIYTNGGVIENAGGPPCVSMTLFDNRLWVINAEDDSLGFSNPVGPATPVQMNVAQRSLFISPTAGSSGSSGMPKCIFPMDDKLIIFLHGTGSGQAINYINGTGPTPTGINNQYSDPIFVTSTISCTNQQSIVLSPAGLMFQAADSKGIYLLRRDLGTEYIGKEVEAFNSFTVTSAQNIPGTNQIRFTLNSGAILMYDYFQKQWNTDAGAPGISSTLFQNLHTLITSQGLVGQETPGSYLDFGNPVLMSLVTGWINLAGLQGYQRAYFLYLLGQYLSPHKIKVDIAYDYNPAPRQSTIISPTNFNQNYGNDGGPYGQGTPYGGVTDLEQWRIFLTIQRCEAIQVSLTEIFDPSFGTIPGAGFTLSGLMVVVGIRKGWFPISSMHSTGGQQ